MPIFVKRLLAALVIVLLLIAMNEYMSEQGLFGFGVPPYYARVIMLAGINITLAVSLNLITGFTGQFSIGHAGFMAVGAYTSAYLTVYYAQAWERSLAGMVGAGLAHASIFLLAILVGALAAAIAGLIVGIPSLRLRGDYLAIVTLGFGEIIRVLILNINAVGAARGFLGIPEFSNFFWVYLFALITVVVVHNLVNSSYGRAFISIRDDEIAAEAMGIDTTRFKVMSFVISSMFAGIAGGLFAHFTAFLSPNTFQFTTSFYLIIMIVVGGMGSIEGAILGAILITVILEAFREFGAFRFVNFAVLLVLVMLFRPQGIVGSWSLFRKAGAR